VDQVDDVQEEKEIVWFYQAGVDPMKEKDEAKKQWRAYPPDICVKLEQAWESKQATFEYVHYVADLKKELHHEIELVKMMQYNKETKMKARGVKRETVNIAHHRLLDELIPVTVQKEEQKTASRAFGNVRYFLNYIMKRTPEGLELYQKLRKLKLDCPKTEYKEIADQVINCLHKALTSTKMCFYQEKLTQTQIQRNRKRKSISDMLKRPLEKLTQQMTSDNSFKRS